MSTEYRITDAKQLAAVLRGYRRTRNLTQSEVAERLGIAQQSYARIEKQPTTTSASNLIKVLTVLGVDLVLRDRVTMAGSEQANQIPPVKPEKTIIAQETLSKAPKTKHLTTKQKKAKNLVASVTTPQTQSSSAQILTGEIQPLKKKKDW